MTDKKELPVDLTKLGKSVAKKMVHDHKRAKKLPKKYDKGQGINDSAKWKS